jgi:hypothetical protein
MCLHSLGLQATSNPPMQGGTVAHSCRKRRLDFSHVEDTSPSLVLASSFSGLDVLAAAASEAAGKQLPGTSIDEGHDLGLATSHLSDSPLDTHRTPSKRSRSHHLSPLGQSAVLAQQFLSPQTRATLISPGRPGLLGSPAMFTAGDLQAGTLDIASLENPSHDLLDMFRDDGTGNLAEYGFSPCATPNSMMQVCFIWFGSSCCLIVIKQS